MGRPVGTDAWIIFSAWATAGAAIATAIMAFLTRSVAKSTREEATETRRLAQQSQDDRELAWRPILGVRWEMETENISGLGLPHGGHWLTTNVGSGPAINCRFVERFIDTEPPRGWSISPAVNVAARGESRLGVIDPDLPIPEILFVRAAGR